MKKNIVVIGDIIVDINYNSQILRNAPEADIPIHNILDKRYILGGAANVAFNLKNLQTDIELLGLIGNDSLGEIVRDLLHKNEINNKLFIDDGRITTQKNRIFHNNNLCVRYDIENTNDISNIIEEEVINYIINKNDINAIIISDYDKGFITENLCQQIIKYSNLNNIPTFIDPKIKNYLKYKNCFLLKPNIAEAEKISNCNNIKKIIDIINEKIQCKNLLITRGKEGMILNSISNRIEHDSIINLVDVTGAGDIVMSVLVYIFLIENDLFKACKYANFVAGKSVSTIGNYCISINDINEYKILNDNIPEIKIIYDYETEKISNISKKNNIVFTNGCFDILHSGHIKNLKFAKSQGDTLIVGLNSDESIKRLKGSERPINDINERSTMLSLLDFVDYVIIFSDDTPFNILKLLKPKTLVKGGDYKTENIIGSEFVEKVILFDYIDGKSSTSIIQKIKNI
jgi:D-beta-D-heptose 7-phosphate kinase/D-beta-D-heptose 1-phosphate adenosyltransferase